MNKGFGAVDSLSLIHIYVETANKITKQEKPLKAKITLCEKLHSALEDLKVLVEMVDEEQDEELLGELNSELSDFEKDITDFHLQTLLSGTYDANNAIISLHAGAGGTEAQDWAQMLMRMYCLLYTSIHSPPFVHLSYLAAKQIYAKQSP